MRKAESNSSSLLVMNSFSGLSSKFSLSCLPLHRPWDPGDDNLSVTELYYFRRFHLIAALLLKLHVLMVEGLEEELELHHEGVDVNQQEQLHLAHESHPELSLSLHLAKACVLSPPYI